MMTSMYLMLHTMTHLSPAWHLSTGPHGWWAWAQTARGGSGFGVIRGHLAWWPR